MRHLAAFLVLALPWGLRAAEKSAKEQFAGAWNLVSYEVHAASGEVTYPFGKDPIGRIAYDSEGHMSVQFMRRDRPRIAASTRDAAATDAIVAAWRGYTAYYGSYIVDEKAGTVTHLVEGAWSPNWIGNKLVRNFSFQGNRLTLEVSGRVKLVWERAR